MIEIRLGLSTGFSVYPLLLDELFDEAPLFLFLLFLWFLISEVIFYKIWQPAQVNSARQSKRSNDVDTAHNVIRNFFMRLFWLFNCYNIYKETSYFFFLEKEERSLFIAYISIITGSVYNYVHSIYILHIHLDIVCACVLCIRQVFLIQSGLFFTFFLIFTTNYWTQCYWQ